VARKNAAAEPPVEARPEGEPNRWLAKLKSSLCARWSYTRSGTLYEIFDLAAFLWALDRNDEALAVAGSVAASVPAPTPYRDGFNYSIWCPATFSHALVVRLVTGAWKARADASRAALLGDAGVARNNPEFIADDVAEARQLVAAPTDPRPTAWECHRLAGSLGSLVLYAELAAAGDSVFERHSDEMALLIPQLLSNLRIRLQSAK
jgi:hypothetical protein